MLHYSKSEIKPFLSLDILAELHKTKAKIALFNKKYKKSFHAFNDDIKSGKENFEQYDDYIEWKAYEKKLESLTNDYQDLQNEHFKVA